MKLRLRHILAALALHALLFGLLFSGVQCSRQVEPPTVIQGALIDLGKLPKPVAAPAPAPLPEPQPAPVEAPPPQPDPAEVQKQEEQKQQAEAKAKAEAQRKQTEVKEAEQKAAELKKKIDAETATRKIEEQKKQAQADEAKRVEDLQKATAAEEKNRLAAEKKKKAEQERLEAAERKEREAELAAALGAEEAQLTKRDQNEWVGQLVAAITRAWNPVGVDSSLHCSVRINLAPSGEVLNVSISASSGNLQFDDSARRAVQKASPLPLPRNPSAFDSTLNLCFWPNNPSGKCS